MVKSEFFTQRTSKRLKLASQVAQSFGSTIADVALDGSRRKLVRPTVKVKKESEPIDLEFDREGNDTKSTVSVKNEEDPQVKVEETPIPKNFFPIYNEVKSIRSKITTPVDSMGCATIPIRIAEEKSGPLFRYRLLVSLMLSSQTKDEVNYEVMKSMNDYFKSVGYENGLCLQAILDVEPAKLDELIHKIGFHNRKTVYLKSAAVIVNEQFNGDIPKDIKKITSLPGVGPKMGYLLLQDAWGINDGIGVDVHVDRLANMWRWVNTKTPEQTRLALEKWLPRELWQEINPVLVGFGQVICTPRGRRCDVCSLASKKLCNNIDRGIISKSRREKESAALRGVAVKEKKIRGDISQILDIEDLA